ncbi:MAG TPA: hypothetical protein VL155_04715, partial [Terriglobales bacterium]|nr:hypothetical protein [Terriglobales bacterium]
KLVVHNIINQYSSMLDILEGYAFGQDLYIRSQACVPLSEMAVRRQHRLPDGTRFMPESIAERITSIAMRMLRNAARNPALLDDVSSVLGWIADMTEEEAIVVIDRLTPVEDMNGVHNRCGLLLYFSFFRESQFPELPRFNSEIFKERLHRELGNGEARFRTSLMWQMAGGAEGKTYPFEMIQPYLESFVAGHYYDNALFNLQRIFNVYASNHRDALCSIMLTALQGLAEYIAGDIRSRVWNVYDLRECFDLIANNCEEQCVLEAVALILRYRHRIPDVGLNLAGVLDRYESARAQGLRALI